MSRPNNYWFYTARGMIMRYDQIKDGKSRQEKIWTKAIEKAINQTLEQENGDLKVQAAIEVLIDKTSTVLGVANKLNYSEINVRRWVNAFVKLVGKNAGY